jgi:hypothetical protein
VEALKRLGARVIAPIPVLDATAQVFVVAAALIGGGALFGVAFGPGFLDGRADPFR